MTNKILTCNEGQKSLKFLVTTLKSMKRELNQDNKDETCITRIENEQKSSRKKVRDRWFLG